MNNYSLTLCIAAQLVENIHHDGGTVLRSSRGGFDIEKILKFLEEKEINQLYIIGGGTPLLLHDTALRLSKMSGAIMLRIRSCLIFSVHYFRWNPQRRLCHSRGLHGTQSKCGRCWYSKDY